MILQERKELKRLHLETDGRVNKDQSQVRYFGQINHSLHVSRTLDKCDARVLIGPQGNRA